LSIPISSCMRNNPRACEASGNERSRSPVVPTIIGIYHSNLFE